MTGHQAGPGRQTSPRRKPTGTQGRQTPPWTPPGALADDSERGSLMLYMVPVTFALLMFAGLILDGGTALAAQGRAADLAAQAARAGADALTPQSLRAPGQVVLRVDPHAAQAAGTRILDTGGATGTITVHDQNTVTVTAHVPAHTQILSAIGFDDASGTATASAAPVRGITTPRTAP